MAETTLYEILEVPPSATQEEIKAAYRQAINQVHPDRGGNKALFRMVQEAYEVLSDEEQRSAYDRSHSSENRSQEDRGASTQDSTNRTNSEGAVDLRVLEARAKA